MNVKVKNLTNRPVLLRLNSGRSLHLAPRAVSHDIRAAEVDGNGKAEKLRARRIIAIENSNDVGPAVPSSPEPNTQHGLARQMQSDPGRPKN